MKIALLGYGKMGRIVEKIAVDRRHEIVLKIKTDNLDELTSENLSAADAAIEFSTPATALANIYTCFEAGIPVVAGTTGWYNSLGDVKQRCGENSGALIYASNFSVGVNVFFHINKTLARLMNRYPYYDIQVEEIHHPQKLDAPSGTAITIAEGIIENNDTKKEWHNILTSDGNATMADNAKANQLLIESLRIDSVPGTHTVIYDSEVDMLELKHTAHNRNGFALGAVLAAEWIIGRQGMYTAQDMFNFDA